LVQILSETFLILRKFQQDILIILHTISPKVCVFPRY